MKGQRNTVVWMGLACLSMVWVGCCVHINGGSQAKAERQDSLSSAMEPGSRLTVRTDFGSITVNGADDTRECRVTAQVTANAPTQEEAQQILDKVRVVLEPVSGGLSLHVDKPPLGGNRSVGASFTVTAPRSTALDCQTSFGSIHVQDISAEVKAHTSFASVSADRVTGPLRLTTSYGQIRGDQIASDRLVADSSFGNIDMTFAPPDATSAAEKFVDVKTSHGSITCRQVAASRVTAHTSFGSIHMECLPSGPSDLQLDATTSHGSITCQAPDGFTGQVDLDTSFGEVRSERAILVKGKVGHDRLTGTIGEGNGRMRLKTEFGGVTLR